jgi:hypothetical protein
MMRRYGKTRPRLLMEAMRADGYRIYKVGRVLMAYKKGRTLKNGKESKQREDFALFIIQKSVKIPPRPFLYIDKKDQEYLVKLIKDGVMNALNGGLNHGRNYKRSS